MKRGRFALIWSLACLAAIVALPLGLSTEALAQVEASAQPRPQSSRSGANIWSPSYDVRLEVLADGSLDVVETIALSVGAKSMKWFEREISARRTDGLINLVALMDGAVAPTSVDTRNGVKVRWEFSPTANTTHTFVIRYRAVRVLAREIDGPRLLWVALPRQHSYPIDSSHITVYAPTGSAAIDIRAPGGVILPATPERPGVVIEGKSLAKDRTVSVDITFEPNSITPVEPQWFVTREEQLKMLPAWLAAGASLIVVGLGILIMMFARLPRPPAPDADGAFVSPADEGSVPPGLVTLLMGRGQQNGWLAMQAAFFRLVRDGRVIVEKRGETSRWKGAAFDVSLGATSGDLETAPHESWILDAIRHEGAKTDMRRLMTRMSRRQRAFRSILAGEAEARGWMDAERQRAKTGLLGTGAVLIISGLLGSIAVLLLATRLGPAPVVIPAVVFLMGFVYVIVSSAMSVLSEPGLREGARWQARVAELKNTIKGGVSGQSPKDFERWFPLAIGAGLGARWLKAFEAQLVAGGAEIGWLREMGSPADAAASLGMLVAISGASHSGGAGGAGGGAGGGSSGAG